MKNKLKKACSFILTLGMIISIIAPAQNLSYASTNDKDIEVTLAADAVSNNLDVTGFSDKLKNQLSTTYGVPVEKIHIKTIDSSTSNSSGFNWYKFEHSSTGISLNDTNNLINSYNEPNITNKRAYHIDINSGNITFYGYGVPAFKDFLYTTNSNANNKVFNFTINESSVNYHSSDGSGFLFGAKYSNDANGRRLSGYIFLIDSANMCLYKVDNIDVSSFIAEQNQTLSGLALNSEMSLWSGKVTKIATTTKPASISGNRYLKLVATPTEASIYQFADNTYSTTSTGGVIFDKIQLPVNFGSFGFGPIASYNPHGCSIETIVPFTNITLTEDTSVGFSDLVRSTSWQYKDSIKVFVNLDNDGVSDFGSIDKLSSILYYTMLNNAHYIGWGINNTINVGGYNSVKTQSDGFVTRNSGKGTFINRSDASTDSLDEGVDAIAAYIAAQLPLIPDIAKPNIATTFGSNSDVACNVSDKTTSNGNPISAYKWKYLDIASGTWTDKPETTNAQEFTFAQNTYSMVAVAIQDSVTSKWSDYSYAYIATVPTVAPISQFSIDKSTLMPYTTIDALKSSVVTADDTSYIPNGGQVAAWEWKVYSPTLIEVSDLGKSYTSANKPSEINFDFSGKAAGTYTIRLRTKNSSGTWSNQYAQQVTVYNESNAISIATTSNTASPNIYVGTVNIPYTITSTGGNITSYRVIKVFKDGTSSIGDWTKTNVASVSSTQSLTDTSCNVYVQAIDASGNSRTQSVGSYSLPPKVVTFNSKGGSSVANISAESNTKITEPTKPVKTGYTFNGWYNAADDTVWNFETDKVTADTTLYAKWTINSYTITFDSKGGSSVANINAESNTKITEPTKPVKTEYTFNGWYNAADDTVWNFETDKVTADTTLYAKWTINSYTITFDSKGGSSVANINAESNTKIAEPTNPVKNGYTFNGWYNAADDTAWNFGTDKVTADTTLYAKWTINSYTITFDSKGGSSVASQIGYYDTTITNSGNPTKTGYTFGGWYNSDNDNAWNIGTDKVTANTTLYAKWTINSYKVAFDSMGGSSVSVAAVNYNSTVAEPNDPTRQGYIFGGWYKDAKFTTLWDFNKDKVTSDAIIYAKWNVNSYNVSGVLTDDSAAKLPVPDVTVSIERGGNTIAGPIVTDSDGKFTIYGVPAGVYNLVMKYINANGKVAVTTETIVVKGNTQVGSIKLPIGNKSSIFIPSKDVPVNVVGNLNNVFDNVGSNTNDELGVTVNDLNVVKNGGDAVVRLESNPVDAVSQAAPIADVKTAITSDNLMLGYLVDLSAYKAVTPHNGTTSTTKLKQLNNLVDIYLTLPSDIQGKSGYKVYRYHDGVVNILTETANGQGEKITVQGSTLVLTVEKFSVYAVAYTKQNADISLPKTGSMIDFNVIIVAGLILTITGIGIMRRKKVSQK